MCIATNLIEIVLRFPLIDKGNCIYEDTLIFNSISLITQSYEVQQDVY